MNLPGIKLALAALWLLPGVVFLDNALHPDRVVVRMR